MGGSASVLGGVGAAGLGVVGRCWRTSGAVAGRIERRGSTWLATWVADQRSRRSDGRQSRGLFGSVKLGSAAASPDGTEGRTTTDGADQFGFQLELGCRSARLQICSGLAPDGGDRWASDQRRHGGGFKRRQRCRARGAAGEEVRRPAGGSRERQMRGGASQVVGWSGKRCSGAVCAGDRPDTGKEARR